MSALTIELHGICLGVGLSLGQCEWPQGSNYSWSIWRQLRSGHINRFRIWLQKRYWQQRGTHCPFNTINTNCFRWRRNCVTESNRLTIDLFRYQENTGLDVGWCEHFATHSTPKWVFIKAKKTVTGSCLKSHSHWAKLTSLSDDFLKKFNRLFVLSADKDERKFSLSLLLSLSVYAS